MIKCRINKDKIESDTGEKPVFDLSQFYQPVSSEASIFKDLFPHVENSILTEIAEVNKGTNNFLDVYIHTPIVSEADDSYCVLFGCFYSPSEEEMKSDPRDGFPSLNVSRLYREIMN